MATAKTSNDNSVNQQFLEQLKDVGNRLLLAPCSSPELLSLLDELVLLLSKVGQAPSQPVQDALLPTMKALISDHLFRNSDADVIITVAACLNEILRISAPVAPYDDDKMKEIFELIVLSFDKLSCPPGRSYSKAILILESVARLRSCVMMLDLDCDSLITKMFQLFQKHSCSSHPHSVFLAMEKIMNVMIKESDSLSVELVKVLLESIRLENQNALPESFKMGAKVIEECSEKLKPYIREAVTLLGYCLQDYAPILSSICETEPIEDLVRNSAKHSVKSELTIDERHSAEYAQPLKAVERCSQNPGTDSETASERGGKLSSHSLDEGYESLTGRGKTSQGHVKRSSGAPRSKKAVPAMEDELSEREIKQAADLDIKKVLQATTLGGSSDKKGKPSKKDVSGGSRKKSTTGLSRKDKIQTNDAFRSQRKRASSDDDVIETPHGRKNYKEDLVGCRIKVWWPLDRSYYEGTISSFDAFTKKHKVEYDDGDEEVLNLRTEQWEFLGDEIPTAIDIFVDKKSPQPRSNTPKREGSTVCEKETSQTNTRKREITPDCEAEADDGSHQVAKVVEKVKTPEVLSEMKRPRLPDGQKS
ncbi:uncharacterized protein LOC110739961 isoform X1 [Chenopodium quinoa]|uniref:uncharacterized protein LOC110739961 isoform X1 n=1 Tax=Chenopodium quinoa TaxID=63459 RepID=UPI000B7824C5|nr:uncharacterized protein LOC110739961 isoform X1 [Chenopodium quinoa]XP_021776135.1 uncharacterized protein LOC110739961 isoform X1 [Chenopodium quinoa]